MRRRYIRVVLRLLRVSAILVNLILCLRGGEVDELRPSKYFIKTSFLVFDCVFVAASFLVLLLHQLLVEE